MHDILVHLDANEPDAPVAAYALAFAARFGANATVTGAAVTELPAGYILEGGRVLVEDLQKRDRDRVSAALARFMEIARGRGVIAETVPLEGVVADLERSTAQLGRHFDISVIGQPKSGDGRMVLVESLLFESGRPVLIVPYAYRQNDKLDTILVAWNGSREGARAISGAMPLLAQAKTVQVISIVEPKKRDAVDLPGFNITRHLARKGVNAELKRITSDLDAGNTLLSHAADEGADLLVMGAYGQSRWREMLLGGATREILTSMTLPVLMAH
ncbi:MAG: universal stress protein [Methylobacteriaceae bacterium]|nr:universal stress protein [Methylobacteriaceae bacterium]